MTVNSSFPSQWITMNSEMPRTVKEIEQGNTTNEGIRQTVEYHEQCLRTVHEGFNPLS